MKKLDPQKIYLKGNNLNIGYGGIIGYKDVGEAPIPQAMSKPGLVQRFNQDPVEFLRQCIAVTDLESQYVKPV